MSLLCERCEASLVDDQCLACGYQEPPSPKDSLLGRCLVGRYLLTRKIGEGSYGVVYEAEHQAFSRRVAIKVLHPHLVKHPQTLARFQREAQALGRLTHPYAVKLYDQGAEGDLHWIALEWLEGETLEEKLRRETHLTEPQVLALLLPLCEVIEEAHEQGMLHRDIKPSNIFLVPLRNQNHLPKLVDFGLARVPSLEPMTSSQNISGTPKYMAPEQWEGLHKTSPQSDLYSLAVVAYESLSGVLPFEADNPIAWVRKLETEKPRDLRKAMQGRSISGGLASLLMQCLEKEPSQRPQTITQLRRELESLTRQPAKPTRSAKPVWILAASLAPLFFLGGYLTSPKTTPPIQAEQAASTRATPPRPASRAVIITPPVLVPQPSTVEEKPKKSSAKSAPRKEEPDLLRGDLKEPFEE